jgi:hypothetical protein
MMLKFFAAVASTQRRLNGDFVVLTRVGVEP